MVQYLKCFLSIRCSHCAFFSSCCNSWNDYQGIIVVLFTNEAETTQEKQQSCQYHGQNTELLSCPDTKGIDPPSAATNNVIEKGWKDEEGSLWEKLGWGAKECSWLGFAWSWKFLLPCFEEFCHTNGITTKWVDKIRVQVKPSSSSLEPILEKFGNQLVLSQISTVPVAWRRFLMEEEQTQQHHECVPGAPETRKIAMILEPKVDKVQEKRRQITSVLQKCSLPFEPE